MDDTHMTAHTDCLMKEEWASLHERMKATNDGFIKYMQSQSEINATNASTMQKILHRIYGNAEDGMLSDIRSNKQLAASETKAVELSLKRLWYAFGLIIVLILGNVGLMVKILVVATSMTK